MMIKKIVSYLTFWKKDEANKTANFNLKAMHKINKISIFMFLLAVVFIIVKYLIALVYFYNRLTPCQRYGYAQSSDGVFN